MAALKNKRHESFAREYIIDFIGAQAALRAGYSKKTARTQANKLLTKGDIQQRVAELQQERNKRVEITADDVLKELLNWAYGDITEIMTLTAEQIKELPPEVRRLIVSFKRTTRKIPHIDEYEIAIEVKFVDKQKAMDMVAKHIGFYEKDNDQKTTPVQNILNLGMGTKPDDDESI